MAHFDNKMLLEVPKQLWENPAYSRRILSVHLENNFLTHIPDQMRALTTLKLLSVAQNRISLVPEWIFELQELNTLSLSMNRIAQVHPSVGLLPRLAHLNVYDNLLHRVPVSLGACTDLHTVVIGRNSWAAYTPDEGLADQVGLPMAILRGLTSMTAAALCQAFCVFLRCTRAVRRGRRYHRDQHPNQRRSIETSTVTSTLTSSGQRRDRYRGQAPTKPTHSRQSMADPLPSPLADRPGRG